MWLCYICVTGLLRISLSYVEAVSLNDVFSVILLWKHTVLCYSNLISASQSMKMNQEKSMFSCNERHVTANGLGNFSWFFLFVARHKHPNTGSWYRDGSNRCQASGMFEMLYVLVKIRSLIVKYITGFWMDSTQWLCDRCPASFKDVFVSNGPKHCRRCMVIVTPWVTATIQRYDLKGSNWHEEVIAIFTTQADLCKLGK